MTITMKQGNNLVIELSTAAYEVFRTELKEILHTNTFLNSNYVVNYEPRYDEQELIVEETYKVHKKRMMETLVEIPNLWLTRIEQTAQFW